MIPFDPSRPPDRDFLRTRIALVLVAIVAAVLVAWLAGPLGPPGVLLALDRMYRWVFGEGGGQPPSEPEEPEVDRPPEDGPADNNS